MDLNLTGNLALVVASSKGLGKAIAAQLAANADLINDELIAAQGEPVDLGGYYQPNPAKAAAAMRPSQTLNDILAAI